MFDRGLDVPQSSNDVRGVRQIQATNGDLHRQNWRLAWVDIFRGLALVWIFLNHVVERVFSPPYMGNPTGSWPLLTDRLAQLAPLAGRGLIVNLLRYVGWLGDQGVTIFLILSGFSLTWGLLKKQGPTRLRVFPFICRRLNRIYPLWIVIHVLFIIAFIVVGWGLSPSDPGTYLSVAGFRATPVLFYRFSPAWWFFGLILQLYLVYPLLWEGFRRVGPWRLILVLLPIAFLPRAAGLILLENYVDIWQRGGFFITRLPEFVFGMCIAWFLHSNRDRTQRLLATPWTALAGVLVFTLGVVLSLDLLGMTVAPFLMGVGVFAVLYFASLHTPRSICGSLSPLGWIGQHSYSLYLVHHPLILVLVPATVASALGTASGASAAIVLTVVSALMLERVTGMVTGILREWRRSFGVRRLVLRLVVCGLLVVSSGLSTEAVVRVIAPQEVFGWGERRSLEPDQELGWKMKPSSETRLRWESYDYVVYSNSLGFPGPEYPVDRSGGLRVMTVGDAFTSAEGVDTDLAWPRLLEGQLEASVTNVEVMNFAVTGYGPSQYLGVVARYAPVYLPDLIIIGFFVNEFQDVLATNEEFRRSIGFDLRPQNGLYSFLTLSHTRRFIQLHVKEPLKEIISGEPRPHGYFLGNFRSLERGWSGLSRAYELVLDNLRETKRIADAIDAKLAIAMIPAPVQVCDAGSLDYYPRGVDISDDERYDLGQPQRLARNLSVGLDILYYDLLPALSSADECPFQRRNMHFTDKGHQIVASSLAEVVLSELDTGQRVSTGQDLD